MILFMPQSMGAEVRHIAIWPNYHITRQKKDFWSTLTTPTVPMILGIAFITDSTHPKKFITHRTRSR